MVVSKDDQVHSRCMLRQILGRQAHPHENQLRTGRLFKNNRIQWIFGRSMTGLDCAGKRALFDGDAISNPTGCSSPPAPITCCPHPGL